NFILKTIRKAKHLRPNASWGLYGFPYCNYDAGKKGEYIALRHIKSSTTKKQIGLHKSTIRRCLSFLIPNSNTIPLRKNCSFYNDQDLCSTIKQPALMGVNGLIFWSSSTNMQTRCNAIKDFVDLKLG
ncbi:hypothetical protein OSTOST_14220, partial [Ostertagia ostertagi]